MAEQRAPNAPGQKEGCNGVQDWPQDSLLGRVGASTSALLQESILRTRPENLTAGLALSSTGSTKGESSSGPPNRSASCQQHLQEPYATQSHATIPRCENSFRTQYQRLPDLSESATDQFNTFITTSNYFTEGPLVYNSLLDTFKTQKGKGRMLKQEDGAAVVKLLSDPGFSVDELPYPLQGPESIEEHANFWEIDEQTREVLVRLKADMPAAPVHRKPSPDNPLSLLPNFNNQSRASGKESTEAIGKAQTSGSYLQTELDSWLGVLMDYQDEVWGDLLPLVKEAREESRNAMEKDNTALKDCPAVRRLGMILGHIGPPKSP